MKIGINIGKGSLVSESKTEKNIIIGIDLGTTNSLVAYLKDGAPVCLKDHCGKHSLVPSIVHFAADGSVKVGDAAREMLVVAPERTIYSAKRLMGKSYKDLAAHSAQLAYKVIDDDTDSLVKVQVGDRFYTPIELSAHILTELKHRAETALDAVVSKAVITVPAYFNDAQRQATRDAGKLAGLDVLRIVNEPTAASLAYGIGLPNGDAQTVAVYDLGGGTFDISILRIEEGVFEVLATHGDTYLGGDDIDNAIVQHWLQHTDFQLDTANKTFVQTLRLEAERAKKQLSHDTIYSNSDLGISLSRNEMDALAQPLIQKTLDACRNALSDAKLTTAAIDKVLMVGGSTRMLAVKTAVADLFGRPVNDDLNPDEVVALGAAVQADILAGNNRDLLLIDVTPLSLGIETIGGLMDVIIPRNTKIPARFARNYTTSVDGQTNLKVAVYQGERDLVQDNRLLGQCILSGIPAMPAALPKIEISFVLNADGILQVQAKELRSGVMQTVEMEGQYGLSEDEMALMLLDSIKNAQSDMTARALLEARNEANMILLSANKFLKQHDAILAEDEKITTQYFIDALQIAVNKNDKDLINKEMAALNEYTAPLAHRAMDSAIGAAIQGKQIG